MKLYGMAGKGTGRVGSMVYAVRKGEQVVREYNPIVANPNTRPQVVQRAKFKLLSQLSAIVGTTGIHFLTTGGVSQRNIFMKKNMPAVEVAAGASVATIALTDIVLTDGVSPAPAANFNRTTKVCTITLGEGYEDVAGAAFVTMYTPELGRIFGYSQRVAVAANAQSITANILVPDALVNRTSVLVWVYRFADNMTRAKYEEAVSGASNSQAALTFDRMVDEGSIIVSQTATASFSQA